MPKKIPQWMVYILLSALLLCFLWMYVSAHCVHLQTTHVYLKDLPPAFDGIRILYVSDIDLGTVSAADTAHLFRDLQALNPDILILGGDYNSNPLWEIFSDNSQTDAKHRNLYAQFFAEIADFSAPLGKFAVTSLDDQKNIPDLAQTMTQYGITCLSDNAVRLDRGFSSIYIAGLYPLAEDSAGISLLGTNFARDDCVIACIHSPNGFPSMQVSEASDGDAWADLVLCGSTHDGQIRFFGNTILSLSNRERHYNNGWFIENGVKLLVSSGLGCEGLPLRLGTQAQVHLLVLHPAEVDSSPLP